MSIFRKRSCALIVAVIVVCLSTLLSVNRTLGSAAHRVCDSFYNGVKYDGYVHKSIFSQLEQRSGASAGLVTIGTNYPALTDVTEALRQCRTELVNAMNGSDLSAMYRANTDLQTAWEAFMLQAKRIEMTNRDRSGIDGYAATLSGAQTAIADAGYNEAVQLFTQEKLNRFPAALLAPIAGVTPPAPFE